MKALKSTLLHTLEVAFCMAVAYGFLYLFQVDEGMKTVVIGLVLAAITKYMRAEPTVPFKDYVNSK